MPLSEGAPPFVGPGTFNSKANEEALAARRKTKYPSRRGSEDMDLYMMSQHVKAQKEREAERIKKDEPPKDTHVSMLSLLYDPPVESCQLRPYVAVTQPDGSTSALRSNKEGAACVQFKWFRGKKRVCSANRCTTAATMQCLCCARANVPEESSFFCSAECLKSSWWQHSRNHTPARSDAWSDDDDDHHTLKPASNTITPPADTDLKDWSEGEREGRIWCKFPSFLKDRWGTEVSRLRSYTPNAEDVGCCLRVQCAPVKLNDKNEEELGPLARLDTSAVLPAPLPPPPRQMVYKVHQQPTAGQQFKVVCYNVLAQRYATRQMYPYCPLWALSWSYRSTHLLREILSHQAHIICLQEVQANHFDKFFQPQLSKAGYDGLFKGKTRTDGSTTYTGSSGAAEGTNFMDGCAIFYKRDRFAMYEKYGIEYNEAARQQTSDQQAIRRLLKGNIALVVLLEELTPAPQNGSQPRRHRKRRLCVANTHIYWDPEYADVKLWQTWVLAQELEKLVLHRNLALLLCGDFNSLTDSAVYQLLCNERIRPDMPAIQQDTAGILPPLNTLTHRLPISSAFATIGEPKYTNYTGHFVGTLDYVFYSKNHLVASSCLDVDSEELVSKHTALPSPLYSSDHICLVTELDWLMDA